MGEEKISKLALKMSIPMIISMISMAIYNIIDTVYISSIGSKALLAVSLCFPIQIMISAVGLGTGIGINSLLSKTLGEKDKGKANQIIFNGMILVVLSYLFIIFVFNKWVLLKFLEFFTDDVEVIRLGFHYIRIITMFSIFTIFQNVLNKILESYAKAKISMGSQFVGILMNILLDPILIYGMNGHFVYGISGAAIATVIGRTMSSLVSLFSLCWMKEIVLSIKNRIDGKMIYQIYKVGLPTILLESVAPIMTILLNHVLTSFSQDAVSLYGIYYKTQSFIFMIISGLNYGMIPIVAFNYGANKMERVYQTIQWFLKAAFMITLIGTLAFMIMPGAIIGMFSKEANIIAMGIRAFRILAFGFIWAGQSFIISAVFQAIGDGKSSLILFFLRKVLIPFSFIILTIHFLGLDAIWFGFTVAEVVSFIVSIQLYKKRKEYRV